LDLIMEDSVDDQIVVQSKNEEPELANGGNDSNSAQPTELSSNSINEPQPSKKFVLPAITFPRKSFPDLTWYQYSPNPQELPPSVAVLKNPNGPTVYVLGTAHVSQASVEEVKN